MAESKTGSFLLISIFVPTFNSEKYTMECTDSILNQTYRNIEMILIYDNSTDSVYEILEDYVSKNKNRKYLYL